ncbi:DNA (cytosine-5-)-methyltransferase [Modestobacter sp. VKM Ac-2986]|uniref:DNA cytosine methyltransferase n=1 Tax=Modestobacter sp. VKM Ac-2986 TaxID=3004140 RepID=UPI0022AB829B|nr:DNA (cytosine-5-)-methyltransferase [Modestobacter sp. VKM Ac-2986]MCZ2830780.1 DNA (cytosine-5-)-methyltransferase [Modestobacter sp. VKM Ac-2986]
MSSNEPLAWEDEQTDLAVEGLVPSRIPSTHPLHQPRSLTARERERYRRMAQRSREQSRRAAAGELDSLHEVNVPTLDTRDLMPRLEPSGLRALSLYSGGGGLDVAFERAGLEHVASYEILDHAASTLARNRPEWEVHGGADGDVHGVQWRDWRGKVDVLHGGPPCQPFSNAGRQQGHLDPRDCWPATVKAIRAIQPVAFVAENVPALASTKFAQYVREVITEPLERSRPRYYVHRVVLEARSFGVPQVRKRVVFIGFRSKKAYDAFCAPAPTHAWNNPESDLPPTMGVREALGLPQVDEYPDGLAPTVRSGLTGPRYTTSICNSTSAAKSWATLGLWPNGVAATREAASAFPTDSGAFRLSVADVALIQGFPPTWIWPTAVYQAVGQIGNAVPPPLGWAVAKSVTEALALA